MTDNAGDMWSNYEGTEAKLYQIQMTHDARPSALFNVRDGFNDFLKMAQDGDSAPPASLELLQSQAGVKLVLTDRNDPDEVGFVQWRCGCCALVPCECRSSHARAFLLGHLHVACSE